MKATITLHGVEPKNIPALHELLDDPAINALLKSSQLDDGENYTVTIVLNGKNVSDPEPLKSFAPLLGVADPDPEAKTSKPSYEEILGAAATSSRMSSLVRNYPMILFFRKRVRY